MFSRHCETVPLTMLVSNRKHIAVNSTWYWRSLRNHHLDYPREAAWIKLMGKTWSQWIFPIVPLESEWLEESESSQIKSIAQPCIEISA